MTSLKHILLVEDQANDVQLTLAAFAQRNLTNDIAVARDGVEALDYLYRRGKFAGRTDGNPAVVLLDIKMPRLNGIEVLEQIKGDPALKRIPVVMLTSSREDPDLAKCYELGVNAYVVKPIDFHQFTEAAKLVGIFWSILNEPPPQTE